MQKQLVLTLKFLGTRDTPWVFCNLNKIYSNWNANTQKHKALVHCHSYVFGLYCAFCSVQMFSLQLNTPQVAQQQYISTVLFQASCDPELNDGMDASLNSRFPFHLCSHLLFLCLSVCWIILTWLCPLWNLSKEDILAAVSSNHPTSNNDAISL